jgi:hypothetical protein
MSCKKFATLGQSAMMPYGAVESGGDRSLRASPRVEPKRVIAVRFGLEATFNPFRCLPGPHAGMLWSAGAGHES